MTIEQIEGNKNMCGNLLLKYFRNHVNLEPTRRWNTEFLSESVICQFMCQITSVAFLYQQENHDPSQTYDNTTEKSVKIECQSANISLSNPIF